MKILEKASWLSLDIVLGAVVLLFFISEILMGLEVPFNVYIEAVLAVWIIYTFDHLRDSQQYGKYSTQRHKFHKRHYRLIYRIMVVAAFASVVNIFFMPVIVVLWGFGLCLFMGVYFYFHSQITSIGLKEFIVAIGYTLGIFLFPLIYTEVDATIIVMMIQLLILAFFNLLIISDYEVRIDKKNKLDSITRYLDEGQMRKLILVLLTFQFISLIVGLFFLQESMMYIAFLFISSLFLLFIYSKRSYFESNERYRLWIDLIFIIPVVFVFS